MSGTAEMQALGISIGKAQVQLRNVQVRADLLIDEIDLEGGEIRALAPQSPGEDLTVQAEETHFRIAITEPNINIVLAANEKEDAVVRNLHVALLSGKARVTGHLVKSVLHLPFTVEVVPVIVNGVRVRLDFQSAKSGISLPAPIVDVLEQVINNNQAIPLDLSRLPVPVHLDEIRCEPGRLLVNGRARLSWPLEFTGQTAAPFTAADPTQITASSAPPELPPGEEKGLGNAVTGGW